MLDSIQAYSMCRDALDRCTTEDKLVVISNLLFTLYQEVRKLDVLYNDLDKPLLENLENYRELQDVYSFNQGSYVYNILNAAHDVLSVSLSISSKGKTTL